MSLDDFLGAFQKAPIVKFMNAEMAFTPEKEAVVSVTVAGDHLQATGVAHGSVITFVADTSAWFTAAAAVDHDVMTSGFQLNLLRPAQAGDRLEARSSVIKAGRNLVVVRTRVHRADGKLVAEGTFTHAGVK